jgi:succinate dehydrogenase / fumarate reductase flavoprotein subunit
MPAYVHGANRLGCNSLIDLVVFGKRVGLSILSESKTQSLPPLPLKIESTVTDKINNLLKSKGDERVPPLRESLQYLMTDQCSVFRSQQGLKNSITQIQLLKQSYLNLGLTNKSRIFNYELQEALELGNMLRVAEVIVYSALQRHESRGAHFRSDYPERNDKEWLKHTFVNKTPTGLQVCYKPVVVGKFAPQKRSY